MPHAIIEISENLADQATASGLTKAVHAVMKQSGVFDESAIKTRSYVVDDFQVGGKGSHGSFVHVAVRLLEGRSKEARQRLSAAIHAALKSAVPEADSHTVEVAEMAKATYSK